MAPCIVISSYIQETKKETKYTSSHRKVCENFFWLFFSPSLSRLTRCKINETNYWINGIYKYK